MKFTIKFKRKNYFLLASAAIITTTVLLGYAYVFSTEKNEKPSVNKHHTEAKKTLLAPTTHSIQLNQHEKQAGFATTSSSQTFDVNTSTSAPASFSLLAISSASAFVISSRRCPSTTADSTPRADTSIP